MGIISQRLIYADPEQAIKGSRLVLYMQMELHSCGWQNSVNGRCLGERRRRRAHRQRYPWRDAGTPDGGAATTPIRRAALTNGSPVFPDSSGRHAPPG